MLSQGDRNMAINLTTFAKDLTYQADTSVRQIFKDLKKLPEIKQLAEQKVAYFINVEGDTEGDRLNCQQSSFF